MQFLRNFIFLLLLPLASLANPLCKPVPHLEERLNVDDYRTCHHRLSLCPHVNNSPFFEQACIKRTLQLNKFCVQLQAISQALEIDPPFLTIQDYARKVAIVKAYYVADGSENYYILTSKKCLIKSALDPRPFNSELKKRYKRFKFYMENDGEPTVKVHKDGSVVISAPLKVTNTCRACEILFKGNLQYTVSSNGELKQVIAAPNAK